MVRPWVLQVTSHYLLYNVINSNLLREAEFTCKSDKLRLRSLLVGGASIFFMDSR